MHPMSPVAAFISFRFGPTDGVSVVARSWMAALEQFGFRITTISGETGSDVVVDGMGLSPTGRSVDAISADLDTALADADLIIVENLLTIPMNLDASRAATRVLAGHHVIVHHHDPPWHRERFAHITELPATSQGWLHVAINRILREELADRGIHSTLIYNGFEVPDPAPSEETEARRASVRSDLGVDPDEFLVAHPVRAIERKNVPAAIRLCEELGATYWLLGPAEEDYASTLEQVLGAARCRVIHASRGDRADIYAACDHVTFPSTWEGFGNPPIEASLYRRTVDVGTYPVGSELRELGFNWLDASDAAAVRAIHTASHSRDLDEMLNNNETVAREHFSFERMTTALEGLLMRAGWLP